VGGSRRRRERTPLAVSFGHGLRSIVAYAATGGSVPVTK